MSQNLVPLKLLLSKVGDIQLESMLQTLDRLHEAVVADELDEVSSLDAPALIGWLEDIIFTAQETIGELQQGVEVQEIEQDLQANLSKIRLISQG